MIKISNKLLVVLGIVGLTLGFQACSDDDTTDDPVVENPDNPDEEDPNGEDPDEEDPNGEDPNGEDPDDGDDNTDPDDPNTDPIPGDNGQLVENGPNTFSQTPWSENYSAGGLSSPAADYSLDTPNPILSETPNGVYMSNVPLTLEVEDRKQ